ncbi:MAG: alpha/beta hydrolase [Anaerolineales bacterium]|nr:alpha/beta hydrolase [Anaerolineales bacterium]
MIRLKRDKQYYKNLAAFAGWTLLIAALSLYFGIPIYQAHLVMHPTRFPIGDISPAGLDLEYEDVILITEDNLQLKGWYIPSTNRAAVILVHAYNGNRTGTIYHAALLAKHGYGVLLYDTRAQGESGGDLYALGWEDHLDIYAALDYLQQREEIDPTRIGLLGLSAGAKASLYAATQTDEIAAVVAEGTRWRTFEDMMIDLPPKWYIWIPTEWLSYQYAELVSGVRNPESMQQAVSMMPPTPILLITAEGELATSQAYFDEARGEKYLWIRDEPGHQIDAIFDQPEEYEKRVIGFFNQTLLEND